MPSDDAVYIEILVRSSVNAVWEPTQTPAKHERWDLRFTDIDYLPKVEGEPQQFRYRTGVGPLTTEGSGESVATASPDDHEPTSSIRFWSDDPKSLIEHGRGYWRYVPTDDGLYFITEYNYDVRFGAFGRLIDRLAFRPLIGWATAWSFDRLRLWIEEGVPPEISVRNAMIHALARLTLAFVWVFLGAVPKLIVRHPIEQALTAATVPPGFDPAVALTVLGVAEIGFGLFLLVSWRWRWPLLVSALGPPLLSLAALVAEPSLFAGPFSPLVSTVTLSSLALVGYVPAEMMPTARHCLRSRPGNEADG